MDITRYLSNIELPTSDENHVKAFLTGKGKELQDKISQLWMDFLEAENKKIPVEITDLAKTHDMVEIPGMVETLDTIEMPGKVVTPDTVETHGRASLHVTSPENRSADPTLPPVIEAKPIDINQINIEGSQKLPDMNDEQKLQKSDDPGTKGSLSPKKSEEEIKETAQNDELALQIKNKFITLPNGKVGQPYNFVFNAEKIGITDIEDFWFTGLKPIGLTFNPETDAIEGTPIVSGEQSVQLFLKRKGWTEGKPVFERKLTITINPDPRSLWQEKLSDKNDPYWKPDSACQFLKVESTGLVLKTERKDIVAASQRGRSHAHEGIFRDDDFGMDYDKNTNWYIITVADGAGSAKASRKGSAIACQTVVKVCKSQLESQHKDFDHLIKELSKDRSDANRKKMGDALYGIVGTAVFKAYKNIEEEAASSGRAVKDFSTTLIVSICKKFKFGWFVGAFWVGDGGIGIYNKNTRFIKVLGESDGGEFAGQTRFLTMPEITQPAELYRRLRFDIVDDFTALFLMSDGITDPKFETDANLLKIEKWDELWADLSREVEFKDNNEKSAEQLLKWLDFWSPGNHDDRTIAILF